jgi:hypothetical protein
MQTKLQSETYEQLTDKKCSRTKGKLTRATAIGLLALSVCSLAWPIAASTSNPVTRPVIVIGGHMTLVVDPQTGDYHFTDWGLATHTGRYSNSGSGIIDLTTGQFLTGTGVVVAANGDTLDWMIGAPNQVIYTGGTGIFQGATGGFPVNVTSLTLVSSNSDGTLTFAVTYDGSGTITY